MASATPDLRLPSQPVAGTNLYCLLFGEQRYEVCVSNLGYRLETGTAAELRLALTITLTLTDTGFAVLTLLLGYRRR